MNSETERKGKIITMLFTAYGQAGEAERMAMYVKKLKDIPADVLDKACDKAVMESRYLPSIAELVQSAQSIAEQISGTGSPSWEEAWKQIEKEMRNTFVYGKPQFTHKEIADAVNAFGWEELCSVLTKDLPIVRAQLRDMYKSICERKKTQRMNSYILGEAVLIESENKVRLMLNERRKQD